MHLIMQEASALETEQSLRRENSHLQTLVDAGTSMASRDDSAMGALQKSFSELMQEREQQVQLILTQWPCAAVFCPIGIAMTSSPEYLLRGTAHELCRMHAIVAARTPARKS